MELKQQIRLATTLAVISLVAGALGHLALTDIYHGEGDLTLEWNMLRVFAVIFVVFIAHALNTFRKISKTL